MYCRKKKKKIIFKSCNVRLFLNWYCYAFQVSFCNKCVRVFLSGSALCNLSNFSPRLRFNGFVLLFLWRHSPPLPYLLHPTPGQIPVAPSLVIAQSQCQKYDRISVVNLQRSNKSSFYTHARRVKVKR